MKSNLISSLSKTTTTHNGKLKFIGAIIPGLGAVVLAFYKDHIIRSTYNFLNYITNLIYDDGLDYSIDFKVIVYYLILILWVICYAFFIINESYINKKNSDDNKAKLDELRNEISSAIHNAPNPKIFFEHKLWIDDIVTTFQTLEKEIYSTKSKEELVRIYRKRLKLILRIICQFTKQFSGKEAFYGANIMRYIPRKGNEEYVEKLRKDENAWIYYRRIRSEYVSGVLYIVPGLVFANNKKIPLVTLPLFQSTDKDKTGSDPIIPGAPYAFYNGDAVIPDTTNMDQYDDSQKKDAYAYFTGPGKEVRSIISISIPDSRRSISDIANHQGIKKQEKRLPIMAVLNIDCSTTFPLGVDRNYAATYFSLIRPVAYLFSTHLEKYFALISE